MPSLARRLRITASRRSSWFALVGVLVLVLLFVVGPTLLGFVRSDALPGVTVLGTDVGGLDGQVLHDTVADIAADRASDTLTVLPAESQDPRPAHAPEPIEASAADVGYALDVEATVAAIRARGRQRDPIAAWRDLVRSLRRPLPVDPVESVDDEVARAWAHEAAARLSYEPVEGAVTFDGTQVKRTDPAPGSVVNEDHLADSVRSAALAAGPSTVTVRNSTEQPQTDLEAVDRAAATAELVVSGPVTLTRGDAVLELTPEQLSSLVRFDREGAELVAALPADALTEALPASVVEALETDPVDAGWRIRGDEVEVTESAEGFRLDPDATAAHVLELATRDGERSAEPPGKVLEPERTTEEAEALGITEQVATFTSNFRPGESRVTNIQRIADLTDGVTLAPGETFSVNDHVGQRTEDKGFVGGGAIFRGEFVEQIGGGVSQFATTLYNAAYFGGYDIVEHKAHSYYIDRYPPGREATLAYPAVDLKIRNNSPSGLLIDTSYTDSSVTVTIWGQRWVEVESIASDRSRIVEGNVRDGFDITVTRVLQDEDGTERREDVTTRYLPENEPEERRSDADASDETEPDEPGP